MVITRYSNTPKKQRKNSGRTPEDINKNDKNDNKDKNIYRFS